LSSEKDNSCLTPIAAPGGIQAETKQALANIAGLAEGARVEIECIAAAGDR
jgi:enamine deaminase RidA (YjgF/YER057c/UK114 family)